MPEILGHQPILQRFRHALDTRRLHHALLFEGPPGVGKSLVATWLAMAANCVATDSAAPTLLLGRPAAPPTVPCGSCDPCRWIAAGSFPDVQRIVPDPEKATPTIAVDQIREVVRQLGYHRFSGRRRFVIIDPAEALPPASANALLKTLEEPPAETGFILIASQAKTLLPTIVSRCQRVRFGPVPEPELAAWLARRNVEAPERVARLALGAPGRALSLADGALADRAKLRDGMFKAVAGDLGGIFAFSEQVCEGGNRQEWAQRVEAMLAIIEELLVDVVTIGSGAERTLFNDDIPEIVDRWTRVLWPGGVAACQRALGEARRNMFANVAGRTLVDALLARLRTELGPGRR